MKPECPDNVQSSEVALAEVLLLGDLRSASTGGAE